MVTSPARWWHTGSRCRVAGAAAAVGSEVVGAADSEAPVAVGRVDRVARAEAGRAVRVDLVDLAAAGRVDRAAAGRVAADPQDQAEPTRRAQLAWPQE
jgi:hypothetical protein